VKLRSGESARTVHSLVTGTPYISVGVCAYVRELMQARITVCIVTRLQLGGLRNCGSFPSNGKRYFFSPKHPYQHRGPSSLGSGADSNFLIVTYSLIKQRDSLS
jgi:hypothetical protein